MNVDVDHVALRVTLFGPFALTGTGGSDATPPGRKARALFAMLVLAPNGRRSRPWLQDRLWSDKPQHLGRASLRHELSDLRRHFEGIGHSIIDAQGDDIVLDLTRLKVDIHEKVPPSHYELLEGMDIGDPEFEYWLSEERAYWYDHFASASRTPALPQPQAPPSIRKEASRKFVPHVTLRPFEAIGGDEALAGFTKGLDTELAAMFGTVVGAYQLIDRQFLDGGGADYILTGTVRGNDRLRIAVQALHAPDGGVVWSEKFDVPAGASFDTQENVARQIVEAIQRVLNDGVRAEHRTGMGASTEAWELYQKGRALEARGGPRRLSPSLAYYRRAIEIDPDFVTARIALAFRLLDGLRNCWIEDREAARAEARQIASDIALSVPENLWGRALSAFLACAEGRFEEGQKIMSDVVRRAQDSPEITSCLGAIHDYCGDYRKGAAMHRHALTLAAFPPIWIRTNLALSLLMMRDPKAFEVAEDILAGDPDNVRALMIKTVCLVRSGKTAEAHAVADTLRILDPHFVASNWRSEEFFADSRQHVAIAEDLAAAGF